jgi:hypothetical protein
VNELLHCTVTKYRRQGKNYWNRPHFVDNTSITCHFSGAFAKFRQAIISFVMSVRPSVCMKKSAPTERFFMKFDILRKLFGKIQVSIRYDQDNGYFTWRPIYVHLITSRSHLRRIGNVSDKSCRENQNTHFTSNHFVFFYNLAFYENKWEKRRTGPSTDDKRRMRISCWIPKPTNTNM